MLLELTDLYLDKPSSNQTKQATQADIDNFFI